MSFNVVLFRNLEVGQCFFANCSEFVESGLLREFKKISIVSFASKDYNAIPQPENEDIKKFYSFGLDDEVEYREERKAITFRLTLKEANMIHNVFNTPRILNALDEYQKCDEYPVCANDFARDIRQSIEYHFPNYYPKQITSQYRRDWAKFSDALSAEYKS